jgi:S-adenosylmethionine synthetase
MEVRIESQGGPWAGARAVEIVERKGLGHPDTICDMLSEQLSLALSRKYLDEFGLILHHNVDKALLAAGRAEPAFGAGRIVEPIDIYLSGRATTEIRGKTVAVRALAHETATAWLRDNMHALAPETDVRIHCLVRPGSADLVELFMRQRDEGIFLANDTSCGTGFAPLTDLERVVLEAERTLNAPQFKAVFPESGEDIKAMGVREHERIALTVSCAFSGRFLGDISAYNDAKDRLLATALETARSATDAIRAIAEREIAGVPLLWKSFLQQRMSVS